MSQLSFRDFLSIVTEDVTQEVQKLESQLADIDAAINQKTGPLLQQRQRVQKLLAAKKQQQQVEQDRLRQQQAKQQAQQTKQQQQSPMQAGQQTPVPGQAVPGSPGSSP